MLLTLYIPRFNQQQIENIQGEKKKKKTSRKFQKAKLEFSAQQLFTYYLHCSSIIHYLELI